MKGKYHFLPFRFKSFGKDILLVNDIGEFHFLQGFQFQNFIDKRLDFDPEILWDLFSKHMAYSDHLAETINLLAIAYRTKKRYLYDFTSLHMFVVTHRCNQKCLYCHASSEDHNQNDLYDMAPDTAKKCVDIALSSSSKKIKIEFQGGEPLLNFPVIKKIIEYAKEVVTHTDKEVEFVICTNLTILTEEHLSFFKRHNILISCSLDGPQAIHDQFRKQRNGAGTYELVKKNLIWASEYLGKNNISAMMTTTRFSLCHFNEIIDEYVSLGLSSVFLRMINPHGYALDQWTEVGYDVDEFVRAYEKAINYIIDLNIRGIFFVEEFAALLLTKILTPFSTGFVDLQSPSGAGLGGAAYEINGDVFIADEGRMFAKRTHDMTFCLGNVFHDSYQEIFCGQKLFEFAKATTIEALPGCAWCVYQPYCGSDPVRNYVETGNLGYSQSKSAFCEKHKAIFDSLFRLLQKNNDRILDVFWSWVTRRNYDEIRLQD